MRRRHWLTGGVAAAAGLAGAGLAGWRWRPNDVAGTALEALWQQVWDGPDGGRVAMAQFQGRPLLLNFWATWCPPCVEELPLLNAFYLAQRARGWAVLGLAVDRPEAVRPFLQRLPLDFPVAVAGLGGTEWSRRLGNPNGGLPFTVLFDAEGRIAQRKIGQVHAADLRVWSDQLR